MQKTVKDWAEKGCSQFCSGPVMKHYLKVVWFVMYPWYLYDTKERKILRKHRVNDLAITNLEKIAVHWTCDVWDWQCSQRTWTTANAEEQIIIWGVKRAAERSVMSTRRNTGRTRWTASSASGKGKTLLLSSSGRNLRVIAAIRLATR